MKVAAFLVSTLLGFLIAHYLLDGTAAIYGSLLISYHLFLAFLIVIGEREKGLSLSIGPSIVTHLAFLAILIGVGVGRHYVPLFGFIRYFTPSLAPFEAEWLFSGGRKKREAAKPEPMFTGTPEDYEEFVQYLGQRERRFSRPGRSLREEQVVWMADRAKRQLR
jgi:hypothetical protein